MAEVGAAADGRLFGGARWRETEGKKDDGGGLNPSDEKGREGKGREGRAEGKEGRGGQNEQNEDEKSRLGSQEGIPLQPGSPDSIRGW